MVPLVRGTLMVPLVRGTLMVPLTLRFFHSLDPGKWRKNKNHNKCHKHFCLS